MRRRRIQWGWTRHHQAALLVCCAAASVVLAIGGTGREWFDRQAPIWPVQAAETIERIDPNTATAASLQRLRGIGETKARAIVDYRRAHGGRCFQRADDLTAVHGIGERLVDVNRSLLRFDAVTAER